MGLNKRFMITIAVVVGATAAAQIACGNAKSDEAGESKADDKPPTAVLWSCENVEEKSCNEYDMYSVALESVKARDERAARGTKECADKGGVAQLGRPCPDKLRRLICHLGKYARTMTAHPKWEANTEGRKHWCPVGRLEDRF